jgi:hypothetical protein
MSIFLTPGGLSLRSQTSNQAIVPELTPPTSDRQRFPREVWFDAIENLDKIRKGTGWCTWLNYIKRTPQDCIIKNFLPMVSNWIDEIKCGASRKRITDITSFPFSKLEHCDMSASLFEGVLCKQSLLIGKNFHVNFWSAAVALFKGGNGHRIDITQERNGPAHKSTE